MLRKHPSAEVRGQRALTAAIMKMSIISIQLSRRFHFFVQYFLNYSGVVEVSVVARRKVDIKGHLIPSSNRTVRVK
jgi:hypothetical protein